MAIWVAKRQQSETYSTFIYRTKEPSILQLAETGTGKSEYLRAILQVFERDAKEEATEQNAVLNELQWLNDPAV